MTTQQYQVTLRQNYTVLDQFKNSKHMMAFKSFNNKTNQEPGNELLNNHIFHAGLIN